MHASKRWELSDYDIKSIGLYILYIAATGVIANITWITELLATYISPDIANTFMAIVGVILKKFITDYTK